MCRPRIHSSGTRTRCLDIGSFGGTCGVAIFINDRGQVVGTSNLAGNETHRAFLWTREAGMKDLGTLGGINAEADWISDSGLVVGRADVSTQNTNHHAFLWKNDVMTDLGVLDPWPCSTALSVNSKGQVIGDTGICGAGGGPNFYSQDGQQMVDINSLVLPGSDLQIVDLFSINERGEIAGGAALPNGDEHAIVLVPANAEEIAAAEALNASRPQSATVYTSLGKPENSVSSGRITTLNLLRKARRRRIVFHQFVRQSDVVIALKPSNRLRFVSSWFQVSSPDRLLCEHFPRFSGDCSGAPHRC